jgi:aspartate carbamoyltransferase catalytic subunit
VTLTGSHILTCDLFDRETLERLFVLADELVPVARGRMVCRVLEGAVLGSLFFEPSTRTRLSFDSAFMRLGGSVSSTTGAATTSISKGESLADTSRVVSGYYDILVVRHPDEGAVREMAEATNIPIINGGNGAGEHPTQAILDLYTIRRELARLGKPFEGRRIVLAGDLRHGRTVHSLIRLLSLYGELDIVCFSPDALRMPPELVELARSRGLRLTETSLIGEALAGADVIYATRLQKERLAAELAAFDYSSQFQIGADAVNRHCRPDVVIMHPLPRDSAASANDLSTDLDRDARLAIFRQTDSGIPTRMALFASVLGVADKVTGSLREAGWFRSTYIGPHDAPFYKSSDK